MTCRFIKMNIFQGRYLIKVNIFHQVRYLIKVNIFHQGRYLITSNTCVVCVRCGWHRMSTPAKGLREVLQNAFAKSSAINSMLKPKLPNIHRFTFRFWSLQLSPTDLKCQSFFIGEIQHLEVFFTRV